MKSKPRKIEFRALAATDIARGEMPSPAHTFIPEYYKRIPALKGRTVFDIRDDGSCEPITNARSCMPFLDALTTGYIKPLGSDVHITQSPDGSFRYFYPDAEVPPIGHRESSSLPAFAGFLDTEFVWKLRMIPKTPPGYSTLITHPLNRYDLPFITLSGIIDSDSFHDLMEPSNVPFLLRKGFEGTIPAGTPMFQIIPIRREDWHSCNAVTTSDESALMRARMRRYFTNAYRRLFWTPKRYR